MHDPTSTADWPRITAELNARGCAQTGPLLTPTQCAELRTLYGQQTPFRKHVVMARHGYGSGEYKYFANPLPTPIATLRESLYRRLAPLANQWAERLRTNQTFPADLHSFTAQCHAAGQTKPTPLLLKYVEGDYNCLHQDLYGSIAFPLQTVIMLSNPNTDFAGGEFVLVEQRPRMQSRAEVLTPQQGEAIIFATNYRPVAGKRGTHRVALRHGVSRLHHGHRLTAGIIFHDAA